jgi:hypothetical protein
MRLEPSRLVHLGLDFVESMFCPGGHMSRKLATTVIIAIIAVTFTLTLSIAAEKESEDVNTRPGKKEVLELMVKSAQMSGKQQNDQLTAIVKNQSKSNTPRSDFLFCLGLAYWNNVQAQKCAGKAYETGRGIIEDFSEAYSWYSLALAKSPDKNTEADQQRMQDKMRVVYPFPSDDDLEQQILAAQDRVKEYQSEVKAEKK